MVPPLSESLTRFTKTAASGFSLRLCAIWRYSNGAKRLRLFEISKWDQTILQIDFSFNLMTKKDFLGYIGSFCYNSN